MLKQLLSQVERELGRSGDLAAVAYNFQVFGKNTFKVV